MNDREKQKVELSKAVPVEIMARAKIYFREIPFIDELPYLWCFGMYWTFYVD